MPVEFEPQVNQPQPEQQDVQVVAEQAEIPQDVEQGTGMQATQVQAQAVTDHTGQVVAQPVQITPVIDPNIPHITIPAHSEQELEVRAHGSADDASTWLAVGLIRKIHIAVKKGIAVFFSQ